MIDKVASLCKRIGYQFNDKDYIATALRHRSVGSNNNERMEFLGDSIVNFVVASILYKKFPEAREGELSRLRANLIKGETLAEIAAEFGVGETMELGHGEMRSGGFKRKSILAGAFEAIVGAIYLDSDFNTCEQVITDWYQSRLKNMTLDDIQKDPKSLLQEYLQGRKMALPNYTLLETTGQAHEQKFLIECESIDLGISVQAEGNSRRRAEQRAAEKILEKIKK